jgi:hypothetical protein
MTRVCLLGALVGLLGFPVRAADLVITPGPTFYDARGLASIFAWPALFCYGEHFDPLRAFYVNLLEPDSVEAYQGCWAPLLPANLILEREETAILPAIGSTTTISVRLASLRFIDSFVLNSCLALVDWGVDTQVSQRRTSLGTMTIRRENEFGGTFDFQGDVFLTYVFQHYVNGVPSDRFAADLGPYAVQISRAGWSVLSTGGSAGRRACPPCSGNFNVAATTLSGIGNSQGDERDDLIRLQDSEISLQLTPACAIRTAVEAGTWSKTKALYR